ncbi:MULTISPECIES: glycosyltransferase family 25 protein [Avibacterium]|uniref:glycosyltransferase family 25 protein n=1 Tax=Avibacterium TaxID=292486 RepID=UPI002245DCDE|nr:glycosyltransferase family 25 protein [Avibacterium sp. 21-594]MCW9716154.1 glycosyltransferase family 25 protein [Avibacterium sp. 21-594]
MISIYVIHIESAKDREKLIKEQFDKLGIKFQFFPAVNARENPEHPLFSHYNSEKHFQRKGRTLSLGELGCFASHYSLWKECANSNTPIIVLEDDITILNNFESVYSQLDKVLAKYPFVWLHRNYRNNAKQEIENFGAFSVAKFYKDYVCTQGYAITPKVAQQFLEYCQEWIYPVDDQMARFYENKIENFAIYPPCIEHKEEIVSLIGKDKRGEKKITISSKIRREYFNLKDRINRFIHNFLFRLKH